MSKQHSLGMASLRIIVAYFIICASIIADDESADGEPRILPRRTRNSQSDIHFYGKLIDQYDNPVGNAKIIYDIHKYGFIFPSISRQSVKTKKDGTFVIKGGNAAKLYIKDALLDGYEYLWQINENSFEYRSHYDSELRHEPDKSHPVILHIRKREAECCYIVTWQSRWNFDTGDKNMILGFDPFSRETITHSPDDGQRMDIEIQFENDLENKQWLVTFRSNRDGTGLQLSEKQLYMAPENGYVQETRKSFKYNNTDNNEKHYVFIRTDSPIAYLRIDYAVVPMKNRLESRYEFFANPYGERLLEEVSSFYDMHDEHTLNMYLLDKHDKKSSAGYAVLYPIKKEADEAWRNRRIIKKPDISKYLNEGILMFNDHRFPY